MNSIHGIENLSLNIKNVRQESPHTLSKILAQLHLISNSMSNLTSWVFPTHTVNPVIEQFGCIVRCTTDFETSLAVCASVLC